MVRVVQFVVSTRDQDNSSAPSAALWNVHCWRHSLSWVSSRSSFASANWFLPHRQFGLSRISPCNFIARRFVRSMASCPGERARERERELRVPTERWGSVVLASGWTLRGVIGDRIIALRQRGESIWDKTRLRWDWLHGRSQRSTVRSSYISVLRYLVISAHAAVIILVLSY